MDVPESTNPRRSRNRGHAAAVLPAWPAADAPPPPDLAAPKRRRSYRLLRDRLIGAGVAAALHLGLLFGFNGQREERAVIPAAPSETMEIIEMPVLEPPETIDIVDTTEAPAAPQLAPPMQMDLPATVAVSNFVQPMRPTLDPALTSVGSITIPSASMAGFGVQGGVRLFDLKELDRVPRRLKTVVPVYPQELRRAQVTGEVVLLVTIDVNGRVEVERVIGSTHREFETAAIKAAEQCVFETPRHAGQPVNARYRWHFPFELR